MQQQCGPTSALPHSWPKHTVQTTCPRLTVCISYTGKHIFPYKHFAYFYLKTMALSCDFTMSMPYDSAISLLGINRREDLLYMHLKTHTRLFIAAMF